MLERVEPLPHPPLACLSRLCIFPLVLMNSPSIIGHSRQCAELMDDLTKNSLSHAYLFAGKKHLGKFTVARWFAESILSAGKADEEKKNIQLLCEKNMHPDLLTLDKLWIDDVCTDWHFIAKSSSAPQQHRAKKKVKTDTIGFDDVCALQERLYGTPQGSHMICLIRSIERLHITAANALLKILEEPPPHVLLVFTTESLGAVPKTIISRMRTLHFFPVPETDLEPLVARTPTEDRTLLLDIAGGAPGIILRCLNDAEQLRKQRQAHIDAHHFYESTSPVARYRHMRDAWKNEEDASLFFHQLLLHVSAEMRGNKTRATKAVACAQKLFSLLRTLETNTQRELLAAHASLSL